MEKRKLVLYFRGKLYENTFRNIIVGKLYTFFYRVKYLFFFLILFHLMISFTSCKPVKVERGFHIDSTLVFVDSFGVNGHSYIKFLDYSGNFMVLHNPDCYCRYNRTFVIIKRSK